MEPTKTPPTLELTREQRTFSAGTSLAEIEKRLRGRVQAWHYEDSEGGKVIVIDRYAPDTVVYTFEGMRPPDPRIMFPQGDKQVKPAGDQSVKPL